MISILTTVTLAINALVFLGFGLMFGFWTDTWAQVLHIQLNSPTAYADFRAMYGGLSIGVGLFFAAALIRSDFVTAALFVAATTSGFLALGRVYTFAITEGRVENFIYWILAAEVTNALVAAWLFTVHSRK